MKKFKNYILVLLVPLILLGCVKKGVSEAVTEDTSTSTLGGYTWSQLKSKILDSTYGVKPNVIWLEYVKSKLTDTDDQEDVQDLVDYLNDNVYTPIIMGNSSFNYNTSISTITSKEKTALKAASTYNYSELEIIKDSLVEFNKTTVTTTGSTIITNVEGILSKIDTYKSENPFYSSLYDLYIQSYGSLGLKKTSIISYFSGIGFDIVGVLSNNTNISTSYTELFSEISILSNSSNSSYTAYLDSTLLSRMNELKSVYSNYINGSGTYSDINDARILMRASDNTQLSKAKVIYWNAVIEDIYSKLYSKTGLDSADSAIVVGLINHINAYKVLNNEYSKTNYSVIHSKTVNILKEFIYLKTYEDYLNDNLGLGVF